MSLSLQILDRLIGFDTVSARPNLDLIDYTETFLRARGYRITRIADPSEPKAGLLAEIGPQGPGGLLLSAHSDVVPTDGQDWTRPPFRLTRDGGRLYGRGTTDMKGFLAQMLTIADDARDKPLSAPLRLLISYDEEIGCIGLARMKDRLAPILGQPALAIVGEPTGMDVAIGHKGKRSYRAQVFGEAGHSALAPRFVSALHVAVDYVTRLRALQDNLRNKGARDDAYDVPYSTIHVGKLTSGTALNIVPDRAEVLLEFRHLHADAPDALEARILDAANECIPDASRVDLRRIAAYPSLATPIDSDAVAAVQAWSGGSTCKVAFGTEAGVLASMGVPTVVCGPGSMEGQGHKADEFIEMTQMEACGRMLTRAVESLL